MARRSTTRPRRIRRGPRTGRFGKDELGGRSEVALALELRLTWPVRLDQSAPFLPRGARRLDHLVDVSLAPPLALRLARDAPREVTLRHGRLTSAWRDLGGEVRAADSRCPSGAPDPAVPCTRAWPPSLPSMPTSRERSSPGRRLAMVPSWL